MNNSWTILMFIMFCTLGELLAICPNMTNYNDEEFEKNFYNCPGQERCSFKIISFPQGMVLYKGSAWLPTKAIPGGIQWFGSIQNAKNYCQGGESFNHQGRPGNEYKYKRLGS